MKKKEIKKKTKNKNKKNSIKIKIEKKEDIEEKISTKRLAVINMDWDKINSADLFNMFSSFDGINVLSVKIYRSNVQKKDFDLNTQEEKLSNEKEEYEKIKRKLFYGIVYCETAEIASKLFEKCDGCGYEETSDTICFQYVPDDVLFSEDPVDTCLNTSQDYIQKKKETLIIRTEQGKFVDEIDLVREDLLIRRFEEDLSDEEIKKYIAPVDDENENIETKIKEYKNLITK